MVLGILQPSSGSIHFDGNPCRPRRTLIHRRRIQLVQQNPLSSLNPNRTVGASLRLALDVHAIDHRSRRDFRVAQLLEEVGLSPELAYRSPAALSGGQRQRIAIARARACRSDLIVLDEPTSALDVIVQARILRLLNGLRSTQGLTYVFITHDLAVVRAVADRVAVLNRGTLVEIGNDRPGVQRTCSSIYPPSNRRFAGGYRRGGGRAKETEGGRVQWRKSEGGRAMCDPAGMSPGEACHGIVQARGLPCRGATVHSHGIRRRNRRGPPVPLEHARCLPGLGPKADTGRTLA